MSQETQRMLERAHDRGWDPNAWNAAVESGDSDRIALTHATNWMDEAETERYLRLRAAELVDRVLLPGLEERCGRCGERFAPNQDRAEVPDPDVEGNLLIHADCIKPGEEVA